MARQRIVPTVPPPSFDVIVIGAGHNGLVAATLLARSGRRVLVLERARWPGGAAVSAAPFPGVRARISRYAYLVSLFPRRLLGELGVAVELRRRRIASYTPVGDAGVLISEDRERTRASIVRTLGEERPARELERFGALTGAVAGPVFASLTEPLRGRAELRRLVGDRRAWAALFEQPLSVTLEQHLSSDLIRGIVATDGLIGTFASLDDPEMVQNRCFVYHVIGNGTGHWDVPVGGMGALTDALAAAAVRAGAQLAFDTPAIAVDTDGAHASVATASARYSARQVVAAVAPGILSELIGESVARAPAEGSQLKLNLLLERLPRLRDPAVGPQEAFAGTFHVNEGYGQLQRAFAEAQTGRIPTLPPCEAYSHSLTDPTVLDPELRRAGAQTLTVFTLHMPARLFLEDHAAAKRAAVQATLRSFDSVLAEPLSGCLLHTPDGEPCLEAHTPLELEAELAMPGGHIFHRDLSWPFAETNAEIGGWGVETDWPNLWLGGAGARRGGGVSGIPGTMRLWRSSRTADAMACGDTVGAVDESQQLNLASWEERVPAHAASPDYALERFVADPSFISDVVRFDLPRLGDVTGLSGVHLQCHIGTDTISLARLGARMTGVDFSPAALAQARRLALDAGPPVDFVETEVFQAPATLGGRKFDFVFTGIGALCWLPSITRWAAVVDALLRPGGWLFIREGHPMLWTLADRADELLVVEHPYFERDEPLVWEGGGTYVATDATFEHNVTHEWNHGLGEIVTALMGVGLELTMLVEHDSVPWEAFPGKMERVGAEWRLADRPWRLPHTYTLRARKRAPG